MLKIIAAVAENGVIGAADKLPWKRLSDDMDWFKHQTGHRPVVMGRKTFWSLPERYRPLPNRENIVLTRHPEQLAGQQVTILGDFEAVLQRARLEDLFVMGGAEIYELALPYAHELYITRVHAFLTGDAFFPEWRQGGWSLTFCERRASDDRNQYNFTWQIWKRALPPASK
jgi:dihydrofolate reductase